MMTLADDGVDISKPSFRLMHIVKCDAVPRNAPHKRQPLMSLGVDKQLFLRYFSESFIQQFNAHLTNNTSTGHAAEASFSNKSVVKSLTNVLPDNIHSTLLTHGKRSDEDLQRLRLKTARWWTLPR